MIVTNERAIKAISCNIFPATNVAKVNVTHEDIGIVAIIIRKTAFSVDAVIDILHIANIVDTVGTDRGGCIPGADLDIIMRIAGCANGIRRADSGTRRGRLEVATGAAE